MRVLQQTCILCIRCYQKVLSPVVTALFGPWAGCRYTPTCSQYALEAIQIHGVLHGWLLAIGRLCRCHPWGGCGFDPVPHPAEGMPPAKALRKEGLNT